MGKEGEGDAYMYNYFLCILIAGSGANTDFTARSETLTFNFEGSADFDCIDISITNDFVFENNERFFVQLTTDDPDVTLDPSVAEVIIIDNDGTCVFW